MTSLPALPTPQRLGLVIDLDTCVGCQACVVVCKEWNAGGATGRLSDVQHPGRSPVGAWLNRVHAFEVTPDPATARSTAGSCGGGTGRTVHFPKSCLHCEQAACVTVCPTGASWKRPHDGIVLVDESKCIGCGLCAWACPYGARELDPTAKVMKKCTLCVDRLDDASLPAEEREPACVSSCPARARHFGDLADPASAVSALVAARGGVALLPELGYAPTNRYLPPRPKAADRPEPGTALPDAASAAGFLGWLDRLLTD